MIDGKSVENLGNYVAKLQSQITITFLISNFSFSPRPINSIRFKVTAFFNNLLHVVKIIYSHYSVIVPRQRQERERADSIFYSATEGTGTTDHRSKVSW